MLKLILLLVPVLAADVEEKYNPLQEKCRLPIDRGHVCDENKPTIRYHMDNDTLTCLAFEHKGCGGNDNSFLTKGECHQTCLPADYMTCSANSKPVRRPNGDAACTSPHAMMGGPDEEITSKPCPEGSSCQFGFVVGLCCNDTITAAVNANYKPDCGPDKKVYKSDQFGFQLIHLGKSCDSNFCPTESTCHQGSYFAYCCH